MSGIASDLVVTTEPVWPQASDKGDGQPGVRLIIEPGTRLLDESKRLVEDKELSMCDDKVLSWRAFGNNLMPPSIARLDWITPRNWCTCKIHSKMVRLWKLINGPPMSLMLCYAFARVTHFCRSAFRISMLQPRLVQWNLAHTSSNQSLELTGSLRGLSLEANGTTGSPGRPNSFKSKDDLVILDDPIVKDIHVAAKHGTTAARLSQFSWLFLLGLALGNVSLHAQFARNVECSMY